MQQKAVTLLEWQQLFSTEEHCKQHLFELRWPEGFICPHCGHREYWYTLGHELYDCKHCRHRTSVTANTLLHSTKIPLVKWFTAIYFVAVDKGGISASRLSVYVDVSWNTARLMLAKLRKAMQDRDANYLLSGIIELDDGFVGGRGTGGKRGRGSETKTAILVACEQREEGKYAGYLKMQVVPAINQEESHGFCEQAILPNQHLKTDGSPTLKTLKTLHTVSSQVTPPKETGKWLPWVHIAIANLKRFLLGTYHGVSGERLQEYLDEFCYRFNRRSWVLQIPNRLLYSALNTKPMCRLALSL